MRKLKVRERIRAQRRSTLIPPKLKPKRFEPQAISVPAAMATRPAGTPPYFTPPNQLTMMIAKQTTPMTGVMNISMRGLPWR